MAGNGGVVKMMADIQILYVKRGYIPDGRGLAQGGKSLEYGDQVTIDDRLTLYFTKNL
jgi:hypothetical protein